MARAWKIGIAAVVVCGAAALYAASRPGARAQAPDATGVEAEASAGKAARRPVPVVEEKARRMRFESVVMTQGTLKSKNFALVSPRVEGVLEEIFVREGNPVEAGKTRLFRTDSVKLEQTLEMSRRALSVRRCSRAEMEANAEKVAAELRKAKADFERYKNLLETKVVSQDVFDEKLSEYEQKQALAKLAEAQIALAREEERRAESAVTIAEKDVRDAVSVAPIDGVVSKRMAEPGENGEKGKAVIRIDDVSKLEGSAFAPGQFYSQVKPGQTKARLTVGGKALGEFTIWYKSPTVDTALRTFEIKCDVPGDRSLAVPGALVEMTIVLDQREGLGVPVESVQLRAGKAVVFVLNGNAARMLAAETGLETDGWVEARASGLNEGTPVVRQGQFLLNDGSPVVLRKAGG